MATHNEFRGYAGVLQDASVYFNDAGEIQRVQFPIVAVRGLRDNFKINNLKYTVPIVRSGNPMHVQHMKDCKTFDIVEVKGTFTTREIVKTYTCPYCEGKTKQEGVISYITPIHIRKRESKPSNNEMLSALYDNCEISNTITLIGNLVNDPQYSASEDGKYEMCAYQLAVKRKFRIIEDDPEKKVDFIWIKSYGKVAASDRAALKKGARVYIDGSLQTREFDREIICSECGKDFQVKDSTLEVVPYAVEYMKDYNDIADDTTVMNRAFYDIVGNMGKIFKIQGSTGYIQKLIEKDYDMQQPLFMNLYKYLKKAIELGANEDDDELKAEALELYEKLEASLNSNKESSNETPEE